MCVCGCDNIAWLRHVRAGVRVRGRMTMRVGVVLKAWSYGKRTRKPLTYERAAETQMKDLRHRQGKAHIQGRTSTSHRQGTGKASRAQAR